MFKYTKKELKHILVASLILAFVFAFNDKQPTLKADYWFSNLLLTILSSLMVLIVYSFFQKLTAYRYKAETEYSLWFIERYNFSERSKIKIKLGKKIINKLPLGAIIAFFTTILSQGKIYFAAISSFSLKENKHLRLGHHWSNVSNYETALIALSGPLANLIIAIVFKAIHPELFRNFISVSMLHSIYCMIPLSQLDGAKIFFNSRYLYFFSLTLILLTVILINFLPILITTAIALILAVIITIIIFNKL